jgi:hypothetical protein
MAGARGASPLVGKAENYKTLVSGNTFGRTPPSTLGAAPAPHDVSQNENSIAGKKV